MGALEEHNVKSVKKKNNPPENKRMICQYCGEIFDEQWKLENHLVIHAETEKFPCKVCNKIFQTKWRMTKHLQNHERKTVRKCKYFKKGQFCPFEKVGCKFAHDSSKDEDEKISNDECKDRNPMKNDENTLYFNDQVGESDCQVCGQFPEEFKCVVCNDMFCRKCILKDHKKNLHYCLNCEDDI